MSNQACCFALSWVAFFDQETKMFQVFQLTALVLHGPATRGERFFVNVNRAVIKEDEVSGVLLCLQDFVRRPHFTQRSFFLRFQLDNAVWVCCRSQQRHIKSRLSPVEYGGESMRRSSRKWSAWVVRVWADQVGGGVWRPYVLR